MEERIEGGLKFIQLVGLSFPYGRSRRKDCVERRIGNEDGWIDPEGVKVSLKYPSGIERGKYRSGAVIC